MVILIDNKEAVLKKGASFDYISENRFFTGADGYTLSITFPLRGCPQNLEIFGRINRKDHDLDKLLLDCEIHDRGSADGTLKEMAMVIASLKKRLDEPFVTVNTVTGDAGIKKAQDEYAKLMANKSPKRR